MPDEFKVARDAVQATFLSGVTATGNGTWHDCARWRTINVHVKGITTATVDICGSSVLDKPLDTAHETVLQQVTSDGCVEVTGHPRWLKVRVSAYTSGTIYAYGMGHVDGW